MKCYFKGQNIRKYKQFKICLIVFREKENNMAYLYFEGVGITAISACVPKKVVKTEELSDIMSPEEMTKFIESVGIKERHMEDEKTCTSDMCVAAAEKLFTDNNIDKTSIDVLLFLSQTGDYKIPITAGLIQERLGLSKDTACMDISLGCSGFIYGLTSAFSYAMNSDIKKVLLLVGESNSKVHCRKDSSAWPLFGDAGAAVLVEKGKFGKSFFYLGSDGTKHDAILMKSCVAGRNPVDKNSFEEKVQEDGYIRSDVHVRINGMDVFGFTLNIIPKSIRKLFEYSHKTDVDVDSYLLHQANLFIIENAIRKLKVDSKKVPINIDRYGNVSSPSIPLLMVTESGKIHNYGNVAMCGFGVGLSWASAYLNMSNCKFSKLVYL